MTYPGLQTQTCSSSKVEGILYGPYHPECEKKSRSRVRAGTTGTEKLAQEIVPGAAGVR